MSKIGPWPTDDALKAERFFEQTAKLVAELPARAETQYLRRLSPIRWAAMAFVSLTRTPDAGQSLDRLDQLDQLVDELHRQADANPEGGSEPLVRMLRKRADELTKLRLRETVELAKRYVKGNRGSTANGAADVATLHDSLKLDQELYQTHLETAELDALPTLRKELYKEVLRRDATEHAVTLRDRWTITQDWRTCHPQFGPTCDTQFYEAYEASTRILLQQVISARVALVLEGATHPIYNGLEKELRSAVDRVETKAVERAERRREKAVRSYQGWALSEIRKFENRFDKITDKADEAEASPDKAEALPDKAEPLPDEVKSWLDEAKALMEKAESLPTEAKSLLDEASSLVGKAAFWRWKDHDKQMHEQVRETMINHLLPINRALLDLPVLKRYEQAFEKGWKKLNGHDEQTEVAKESATVTKKRLQDVLENGL